MSSLLPVSIVAILWATGGLPWAKVYGREEKFYRTFMGGGSLQFDRPRIFTAPGTLEKRSPCLRRSQTGREGLAGRTAVGDARKCIEIPSGDIVDCIMPGAS